VIQKRDDGANWSNRRTFMIAGGAAAAALLFEYRYGNGNVEAKADSPKQVTIVEFSQEGQRGAVVTVSTIVKTDAEWKQQLSPISYDVTRLAGTERAYTGSTWNNHEHGIYRCICCDTALFSSETKFESGTGWPSFWQPIAKENVRESTDLTLGMERTEVLCKRCEAHLGHVFDDGPRPTGLRYCMNSAAMNFVKLA
jgi:peptide-methionine (R)-S-oxide reductase